MYYSDNSQNYEEPKDKSTGIYRIAIVACLIILAIFVFSYLLIKVSFPHADCKIKVDYWYKNDFWKMMDLIKIHDPEAYSLICNNVNEVNFEKRLKDRDAAGLFESKYIGRSQKIESRILILKSFWSQYNKPPFAERAEVFIHEVCHSTFSNIRGNIMNMNGCDIEYPCYLRGALLMYKLGHYDQNIDPYQAMLNERKECGSDNGGPNNYCRRASIKVKNASNGKIVVENNGTELVHCMMLELSINGVLHPVDCGYIYQNSSATISNKDLNENAKATLRIFGCDEKISINIPSKSQKGLLYI